MDLQTKFLTLKSLNSLIGEMSLGMISPVKSETKDLVVPAILLHLLQLWSLVLDLNMVKMSINSLHNFCLTVIMTEGCEGGWPHFHAYFAENGHVVSEKCAPY
jgi:hypothetical protein